MERNNKLQKMITKLPLWAASLCLLTSCGSYYYADGIYGDIMPERNYQYEAPRHDRYDENQPPRHLHNNYKEYFAQKAQQYKQAPDTTYTAFTDVNSYRSSAYDTGGNTYGGWGSNAQQVNVNVYNHNRYGYPYSYYYPYSYGYYPYYTPYRSGWSFSLGWSSYDPYWGSWGNYYYSPYYDYYGYRPYGYYPYGGYYGYYPYYGYYYPYGYGYYGGYNYGYQHPREYYYEPDNSYRRNSYSNQVPYYGRGRAIIKDDGRRGDPNRYEEYNYNYNTEAYGRRQSDSRNYNNSQMGRNYNSNSGNYNYNSNSGNYNSSSNSDSSRGYKSPNRD